jgi:hypothetical protein
LWRRAEFSRLKKSLTVRCATRLSWPRADHRHWHVAAVANAGHDGVNYKPYPTLTPSRPFQVAGAVITVTANFHSGTAAVSLSVLMWLVHYRKLGRASGGLRLKNHVWPR